MNTICYLLIIATSLFSLPSKALAQQFPQRSVTIVVPYAAGGNVDTAARILSQGLTKTLGQPIVIENKGGAGGMLGGSVVERSIPDGHTLFLGANGPIVLSPLTFSKPLYYWDTAFAPISSVSFTPLVLMVRATLPAKTVKELIDLTKKQQGGITLSTGGAGSVNHMLSELMQISADVKWRQVHYKGTSEALKDLLGGHIDAAFDQTTGALSVILDGRLRALAVTSKARISALPDVPTMAEAGFPQFQVDTFTGLLAPKNTPKPVIDQLSRAVTDALKDKTVVEKFASLGAEARGSSPQEFARFLQNETEKWGKVIRDAKVTVE